MNTRLANLISVFLHPLMMATYLFGIIVWLEPLIAIPPGYTVTARWLIVLVVWLTTFTIPVMSLLLLKFTGNISSLKLESREERIIPYFYVTLFYGFTAYYFAQQMLVTRLVSGIFIVTALIILLAAIINVFWKISVHSLSMGGVVGILIVLAVLESVPSIYYLLLVTIVLAGLVMSARLRLQAHDTKQVYIGFGLGLIVSFMTILWG